MIGQEMNGQKGLGYIIFSDNDYKGPISKNMNKKI